MLKEVSSPGVHEQMHPPQGEGSPCSARQKWTGGAMANKSIPILNFRILSIHSANVSFLIKLWSTLSQSPVNGSLTPIKGLQSVSLLAVRKKQ